MKKKRVSNITIPEPRLPLDDANAKGCLVWVKGRLTYFVNRPCVRHLMWDFWFNYAESPPGEDPSLINELYPSLTDWENYAGYSEATVLEDCDAKQRSQTYPSGYLISDGRLDFYVTRSEFRAALLAVRRLGRKEQCRWITKVRIFGCVDVVLTPSQRFRSGGG